MSGKWQKFGDKELHGVFWVSGEYPESDGDVDDYGRPVGWHTGRNLPFLLMAYIDFVPDDPAGLAIEIFDTNDELPGCSRLDEDEVVPLWVMPVEPPVPPALTELPDDPADAIKNGVSVDLSDSPATP